MALSSRSLALGITQQVWSFGSPDFPRISTSELATTSPTLSQLFIVQVHQRTSVSYFNDRAQYFPATIAPPAMWLDPTANYQLILKLNFQTLFRYLPQNSMYKFAAASIDEPIVFGSARPGYTNKQVKEWIEFMQQQGIRRVCCLLSKTQIDRYVDLLSIYRQFFGLECICWTPIEDFHFADREVLIRQILPFLAMADRQHEKVVIHCAGGIGRTGHILAAWLATRPGFTNKLAIDTVKQTGRNPYEAVIAAPFIGRNPWQVAAELNLLLDECRRYDLNSLPTAINPNLPTN